MRPQWMALLALALVAPVAPAAPPDAVIVPVGRDRDVAEYRLDERGWSDLYGFDYEQEALVVFRANGTHVVSDANGGRHQAVMYQHVQLDPPGSTQWNYATTQWVDVETRDLVRFDRGNDLRPRLPLVEPQGASRVQQAYLAPVYGAGLSSTYSDAWVFARMQGETFRTGDDATHLLESRRRAAIEGFATSFGYGLRDFRHVAWVGERARVGDAEVIAIRSEDRFTLQVRGYTLTQELRETVWLSESSAFPLRWNYTMTWDESYPDGARGQTRFEGTYAMTRMTAAGDPVPWGPARDPDYGAPSAERSPPRTHHPASGEEWRGRIRIEDALRGVAEDPTLLRFRAWQTVNPGHVLVWATYCECLPMPVPDAGDGGHATWELGFAAPGGETMYRVAAVQLADGTRLHVDRSVSTLQARDRLDPAWLPDRPLTTWAAADAAWGRVTDEATHAGGFNYAYWGLILPPAGSSENYDHAQALRSVSLGRFDEDATDTWVTPSGIYDGVWMDAESGQLLSGFVVHYYPDVARAVGGRIPEGPPLLPADEAAPPPPALPLVPLAVAAASGVALVALLAYFLPLLKHSFVSLYSRLDRARVLDHALRDALLARIAEHPGVSPPRLGEATGAPHSTLVYHLDVLERHGLVVSMTDGRHRRYFLVGGTRPEERARLALLQNDRTREVLHLVAAQPGIDRATVARMLGISGPGAHWHIRRLLRAGLVAATSDGRVPRYHATTPPADAAGPAAPAPVGGASPPR